MFVKPLLWLRSEDRYSTRPKRVGMRARVWRQRSPAGSWLGRLSGPVFQYS
jgi:hypothetical protein